MTPLASAAIEGVRTTRNTRIMFSILAKECAPISQLSHEPAPLLEKPMSELYEFLFCPIHGMVWTVIFSLTGQDFRGTIAVTVGLVKSKWRSK